MPTPVAHLLADPYLAGDLARNVPETAAFPASDDFPGGAVTTLAGGASGMVVRAEQRRASVGIRHGGSDFTYDELLMLAAQALTAAALIGRPTA